MRRLINNLPPNLRLQRTPSAPLSRKPFGDPRKGRCLVFILFLGVAAATAADSQRKCVTVISASTVLFPKNSAEISEKQRSDLDRVARVVAHGPEYSVIISGACLTEELGRSMDTVRALAVQSYLVASGMPKEGIAESHAIGDQPGGLQPLGGSSAAYLQLCIDPEKRGK